MAEQPDSEHTDNAQADRLARRELQRQRIRRRRLVALAALAAVAIAVVALISLVGGSDNGGDSSRKPAENASAAAEATETSAKPSGLVRNATPQPGWRPYTGLVPILEYHTLGEAPAGAAYPQL